MKVTRIIQKDLKILLRSKSSAIIVLLGPVLIMLFSGIAFNTSIGESVNLGVYSEGYNNLTESFISSLEGEEISVERFSNEDRCIDSIRKGIMHACIVFPAEFSVENEGTETIGNLIRIL